MKPEPLAVRIARFIGIMLMIFPGIPIWGLMCLVACQADRWSQRRR